MMTDAESLGRVLHEAVGHLAGTDELSPAWNEVEAMDREAYILVAGAVKAAVMHDVMQVLAAVQQRWTVGDAEWSPSVADHDAALEVLDAIGMALRLPSREDRKDGYGYGND